MKISAMDPWNIIAPEHLAEISDEATARDLFRKSVRHVEIEVFSYCNRRCWFCPNSHVDRISTNQYMDRDLYSSILDQLSAISYDDTISYSRYNEPLADRIILDRIKEAREKLPHAKLHTNTNGDYLNRSYLTEIFDSGLDSIGIQLYLKNEELYNHTKTKYRAKQTAQRLEIDLPDPVIDDEGEWLEYHLPYRSTIIRMYGRNFSKNGTSRGDQVDIHLDYQRTSPCLAPIWTTYIDYDGSMMPCCNVRSDIDDHKPYIIEKLKRGDDLFLAHSNYRMTSMRRLLLNEEVKTGVCRSCNFALEAMDDQRRTILRNLNAIGSKTIVDH